MYVLLTRLSIYSHLRVLPTYLNTDVVLWVVGTSQKEGSHTQRDSHGIGGTLGSEQSSIELSTGSTGCHRGTVYVGRSIDRQVR